MSEWLDVCFWRNLAVQLKACERLGIDPTILYNAMPTDLRAATEEDQKRAWITLPQYNKIQDALVDALGHPYWLTEVGDCAPLTTFGGIEAFQLAAHRVLMRWITSPRLGVAMLANAARAWNENKEWRLDELESDHALIEIVYPERPHRRPRKPIHDRRSLLFYIRGILRKIPTMWMFQPEVADLKYVVVQVPLLEMLRLEVPTLPIRLDNNILKLGIEEVGHVVWLIPNSKGIYAGEYVDTATMGDANALPALLLTSDIRSICRRTHQMLPLAFAGEIYAIDSAYPLPATIIRLSWSTHWLARFVEKLIPDIYRAFRESVKLLEARASESAEAARVREELRYAGIVLERKFPNRNIKDRVLNREFGEKDAEGIYSGCEIVTTFALCYDIVGSKKLAQGVPVAVSGDKKRRFLEAAYQLARWLGIWHYNLRGDGGLCTAIPDWGDVMYVDPSSGEEIAIHLSSMSRQHVADRMVQFARALHTLAHDMFGWRLRVGIDVSDVQWNILEDGSSIHAHGPACDNSARLESAAPNGETLASSALVALITDNAQFGNQQEVKIKDGVALAHLLLPLTQSTEAQPGDTENGRSNPIASVPDPLLADVLRILKAPPRVPE